MLKTEPDLDLCYNAQEARMVEKFSDWFPSTSTRKQMECLYRRWVQKKEKLEPDEYLRFLLASNLSASTIKKCLYLYKKVRKYQGKSVDVSTQIKYLSQINNNCIKAWTKTETEKAICTARVDSRLYPMLIVALHTGMRKGEMFNLTWRDVNFSSKRLHIRNSKTGRPRSIPMSPEVEKVLQERYDSRTESNCFDNCDVNYRLKRLCKMAGINSISWHGLRHTHATLALDAGRSPRQVATMLGHSQVSTTLDIYWQQTGEDMDLSYLP